MSRLTGNDAKSLMEAYVAVYTPQEISEEQVWEQVEEWVNSLVEEGYDLSEYTWEEMYEAYIEEQGTRGTRTGSNPNVWTPATTSSGPAGGGMGGRRGGGSSPGGIVSTTKPSGTTTKPTPRPQSGVSGLSAADRAAYAAGGGNAAAQRGMGQTTSQVIAQGKTNLSRMDQGSPAPAGSKPSSGPSSTNPNTGLSAYPSSKPSGGSGGRVPAAAAAGAATGAAAASRPSGGSAGAPATARPSGAAPSGGKPTAAAAPAAKPTPAAQTGDRAKDMDTWAKANPKLAAASAERARTRGTSATTNPLMKDFKSRLPAPAAPAPSSTSASPAANPFKNTAAAATAVKSATSPSPTTPKAAPTSSLGDLTKKAAQKPAFKEGFDAFDVVIGHLLDEGYADTKEAALAIMTNMSEEWKNKILENS